MDESQNAGVKGLAAETAYGTLGRPVHSVPQKGMADTGHVDANLMGAACLQPALHMGVLSETVQNPVMGYGILAVLVIDAHLLALHRMAADGSVHCPLIL